MQGYAPGSWSQVAVDRTQPNGRVVGIDIIPAQPPRGVSTIQGNFLSLAVQEEVKKFLRDSDRGRLRHQPSLSSDTEDDQITEEDLEESSMSYVEMEKKAADSVPVNDSDEALPEDVSQRKKDDAQGRMVDVVLSDMSAPWDQVEGFWKRSKSNPYLRMMNTSGINTRDHGGSMVRTVAATTVKEIRSC
ncbi:MAG: hypothetical protein Q9191_002708 [Dirinaria sp. TL-2023a]